MITNHKKNKDGLIWRRLLRITNDELEKLRLNFSRCTKRDVAFLKISKPAKLVTELYKMVL